MFGPEVGGFLVLLAIEVHPAAPVLPTQRIPHHRDGLRGHKKRHAEGHYKGGQEKGRRSQEGCVFVCGCI